MIKIVEPEYDIEYEIVIQYKREGHIYHDRYYSVSNTPEEALIEVTALWHENNDHLPKVQRNIKLFMEVV